MTRRSSLGGGHPIGDMIVGPDAEPILTLGDASVWLRQGSFALASAYPRAAQLEHLKAINFSSRSWPSATSVNSIAANGTGVVLAISSAGAGSVERSADGGLTWGTVGVPGSAGSWHRVFFLNGKFWLVSNDTNNITLAESTTGAAGTWTTRAVTTTGAGTIVASTAELDWTGANFVVSVATGTAGLTIHTSPTGVAWTARTYGTTLNSTSRLVAALSNGVVLCPRNSISYRVSTDHGVTWGADVSAPASQMTSLWSVGNRFYMVTGATVPTIWTASDPSATANWVQVPLPHMTQAITAVMMGLSRPYRSVARDFVYAQSTIGARGYALRFDANGSYSVRRTNQFDIDGNSNEILLMVDGGVSIVAGSNTPAAYGRAACGWDDFNAVSLGRSAETSGAIPRNLYVRVA